MSIAAIIQHWRDIVEATPAPKFDRMCVSDLALLDALGLERRSHLQEGDLFQILGFPVIMDDEMDEGVIELRLGDEVYQRLEIVPPTPVIPDLYIDGAPYRSELLTDD